MSKAWDLKSVRGWALICHPRGGATYIGDADCDLNFYRSDPDNFTEALCVFENKWKAKRHLTRAKKMGVKVPIKIVPVQIILNTPAPRVKRGEDERT